MTRDPHADLRDAVAVAREAVADALYVTDDGTPMEDVLIRVRALLAAAESLLPAALPAPNFKGRPAPVAATLYSRRVG